MTIFEKFPLLANLLFEDEKEVRYIVQITIGGLENDLSLLEEIAKSQDRMEARNVLHRMRSGLAHLDLNDFLEVMPRSRDEDLWIKLPPFMIKLQQVMEEIKGMLKE